MAPVVAAIARPAATRPSASADERLVEDDDEEDVDALT